MKTLYCQNCGTALKEGAKFCESCGTKSEIAEMQAPPAPQPVYAPPESAPAPSLAPAPAPAPPPQAAQAAPKIKINIKKLAVIAGAAVAVIIAAIVAVIALSPSQYNSYKGEMYAIQAESDRVLVSTHRGQNISVDGALRNYQVNMDGTKMALLVEESGSFDGSTLYHVSGGNLQKISEDVRNFWFAASGNGIAYTQYLQGDRSAELYLWTGSSPVQKISVDIGLWEHRIVLSPDGKTLGFVETDGEDDFGVIYSGGTITELGREFVPIGVANGAKYIYYTRMSDSWETALWVQRGLNESTRTRLTGNLDSWSGVFFNRDMSQVVYSTSSRSAISDRGREPVSLLGHVYTFILPYNTAGFGQILGVRDFKNTVYQNTSSEIIHINNKFETRRVERGAEDVYLANDGKTLTFSRNGRIERIDAMNPNAVAVQLVERGVRSFVATAKGDAVFYVNNDRDIMYQRGGGMSMSVANDFNAHLSTSNLFSGDTLFFIQDRELYTSSGRTGTRVSGINGDVIALEAGSFGIYLQIRDGNDWLFYHSTNGRSFSEIR
jgi:hypothetical protein